jgi:hypothetical protein
MSSNADIIRLAESARAPRVRHIGGVPEGYRVDFVMTEDNPADSNQAPRNIVIRYDPERAGVSLHIAQPRSGNSPTPPHTPVEQQQDLIDLIVRQHAHAKRERRFWTNERLLEAREVRHLAGLDTTEIDTVSKCQCTMCTLNIC